MFKIQKIPLDYRVHQVIIVFLIRNINSEQTEIDQIFRINSQAQIKFVLLEYIAFFQRLTNINFLKFHGTKLSKMNTGYLIRPIMASIKNIFQCYSYSNIIINYFKRLLLLKVPRQLLTEVIYLKYNIYQRTMYYYGPYHPIYSQYAPYQYSYFPIQSRGFSTIDVPIHQNTIQQEDNVKIQPKEETELKPDSQSLTFRTTKRSSKPRKLPKDKNFSIRNQDKKRNLISKTIKYFLKYAKCQAIQLHKIEEAIARYGQKCSGYSAEKFIEEIKVRFPEGKHYYSLKSISNCFIDKENPFGIVFRVLFRSFMKWENVFKILYMGKLKRKSKIDYLEKSREIYSNLINTIGRCR